MQPLTSLPSRQARRRLGLTLIEAALVLGVVALVFGGLAQILGEASENQRGRNVAERVKEIAKASEAYLNARLADVRKLGPGGRFEIYVEGITGNTRFPGLVEAGYLPSTYRDSDAYNQHHIVLVRVLDPSPGTTQNRVEAMVTTLPLTGKSLIPLRLRGRIASMIGSTGGFCRGATPGSDGCSVISGVGGGWVAPASDWQFSANPPVKGSVQALVIAGDNSVLSDYLNRNDVGDKAANTMNTTIYSAAPAGEYAMVADPSNGQTTLKLGPSLTVGACSDTGADGSITACNDMVANRFVDRQMPSFYLDPGVHSELNEVRMKKMDITETKVFTTDADRLQGNDTVRLRDLLPRYVAQDGYIVEDTGQPGGNTTAVAVPECANGGTPRIFLAPMQDSFSYDLNNAIKTKSFQDYLVSMNGAGGSTSRPGVTNVDCNAGGCTTTTEGFLSDQLVGTREAVSKINIGSVQLYRQYAADNPTVINGVNSWNVRLAGSAFAQQANGQPVPWRALATTYCYY